MKRFQEKRQTMSRMYSRGVLLALAILIIFLGKGVFDIYTRERESARMRADSEAKLATLKAQKDNLASEMDKIGSDSGVESEIRSKFNVAKPGENVVLIVDDTATTTATSTPGFFASLWAKIWK